MFEVFMYSFNAVMPILLLCFLGYLLRCLNFADQEFFKKANKLVFRVFLPVLLFYNIYEIETLSDVNWKVVIYCALMVVALLLIGIVIAKLFIKSNLQKGPIIQCTFRSNCAILGIALAESLGGSEAVSFTAVATSVTIPMFNAFAVWCLSYYAEEDKKPSMKSTLYKVITNPLIIGVGIGLVVIAIRSFIPVDSNGELVFSLERDCSFFFKAISMASKTASPLALVVLGARFDFSAVKGLFKQITLGVFLRTVFAPALAIGVAVLLSSKGIITFTATEYPALIAIFGSPIAVSSAVMIGEIGGDDQLGAQLVVWTSVFSMFTIFATVFLLRSFSLL